VLYALARLLQLPRPSAQSLAFALPQGGEFAFVLYAAAVEAGVMSPQQQSLLVVVVTVSMAITPVLYALHVRWRREEPVRPYDPIDAPENPVIIAGFGPFGQIVGRVLRLKKIGFTVLEKDSEQVDFMRGFGTRVYYGDASRLELLRAAHAHKARWLVLAVAQQDTSLAIAETVRRNFPQLRIYAVARTRQHALRLLDLGVEQVIRRGYFSSLEMVRGLLLALGDSPSAAARAIDMFREADQRTLERQRAVAHDEQAVIQTGRESARELEQLFEEDAAASAEQAPGA
ncbi:MAG TPA: NAD-binding protein, partial [Nevskiaceae bacterium]|nr:NAD-binding protein [Nevskiaceae bacterium]